MIKKENKLVFNSEEEILAYEKKLSDRLEDIAMQAQVMNDSANWWIKQSDALMDQIDSAEKGEIPSDDLDRFIAEATAINNKGEKEIQVVNGFEAIISGYLEEKTRFNKAVKAFVKKQNKEKNATQTK